jgi:hypothetical protein
MLRQDDERKYDFALRCLKEIGISNEEISEIFPKYIIQHIKQTIEITLNIQNKRFLQV